MIVKSYFFQTKKGKAISHYSADMKNNYNNIKKMPRGSD
jgi:hypothetical protein